VGKELRVFEVDRPETQQRKRKCVAKANLQIPNWLSLVTVDFEQQAFVERLKAAGFNDDKPALTWLGVVPYLSRETVFATLVSNAKKGGPRRGAPPMWSRGSEISGPSLADSTTWGGSRRERKMTKKLTSVFEQLAKLLAASGLLSPLLFPAIPQSGDRRPGQVGWPRGAILIVRHARAHGSTVFQSNELLL